jgi:hypothetical protein
MPPAKSISLRQFTSAVQAAVKAAVKKHPKFNKVEAPQEVTFSYLIRGFPLPPTILSEVSFGEVQAFANDVANQAVAQAGVAADAALSGQGAIYSHGGHIICGIPPVDQFALKE